MVIFLVVKKRNKRYLSKCSLALVFGGYQNIFLRYLFLQKKNKPKTKEITKKINLKRLKSMHIFSIARLYIYVHVCTHVSFTK